MSYVEEFRQRITRDDYQGFVHLWEEYCGSEEIEGKELVSILDEVKHSRFANRFGQYAETAIPLWEQITDPEHKYAGLRLILDMQTTNSPELGEITYHALEEAHKDDKHFNEKMRLIGLRNRDSFQGAITNYDLLSHLDKGRFVYHTGGWGTGEVMDLSMVREEISLEFEAFHGVKSLSFENAFGNLIPLDDGHFLARRFGDPDALEAEARENPTAVIRMLLKDLGPRTASEIKDELCELVIPAEDWTKWWQGTRNKIKKDTQVETPPAIRVPFKLRTEELSHAERMRQAVSKQSTPEGLVLTLYNFVRDFPEVVRDEEAREFMKSHISEVLGRGELPLSQKIEATALVEEFFDEKGEPSLADLVAQADNLPQVVQEIGIAAFKKRVLVAIRQTRSDWADLFLEMFFTLHQSALRDYLLRELSTSDFVEKLQKKLEGLLNLPISQAHLFLWYFQKVMSQGDEVPLGDPQSQFLWFEAFLTLTHQLDYIPEERELTKKAYGILVANRFQLVRDILKNSSIEFAREFLLLVSKCHGLTMHDKKIMQSLAEVVHKSLTKERLAVTPDEEDEEMAFIWTSQEGYQKVHERIEQIGTVETVDNAKEIERARELGDLRENAEYKAAVERRSRLQAELKMLSDQLHRARVLTEADIAEGKVDIGSRVVLKSGGEELEYTLLGPWDAKPEEKILSYQSKLAQAMTGLQVGDTFTHQDKEYEVLNIGSVFANK